MPRIIAREPRVLQVNQRVNTKKCSAPHGVGRITKVNSVSARIQFDSGIEINRAPISWITVVWTPPTFDRLQHGGGIEGPDGELYWKSPSYPYDWDERQRGEQNAAFLPDYPSAAFHRCEVCLQVKFHCNYIGPMPDYENGPSAADIPEEGAICYICDACDAQQHQQEWEAYQQLQDSAGVCVCCGIKIDADQHVCNDCQCAYENSQERQGEK